MTDKELRDEFPATRELVYLNHAAVAPLSARARDRICEWADDMARRGNVAEGRWYGEIEKVRAQSAALIGADPAEIALLKNTSEGLSLVAEGLDFAPGDNVVTVANEFPSNLYPWLHLAGRGVETRRVAPQDQGRVSLDDLDAAIDARTRLLSISFVQYGSGFRMDLAQVGRLCRDRGVLFCVDAIQGLGVFPVDVEAMQIDFLSADGHKWLVGPEGAAIVYVRREHLDRLRPTCVGWRSVANSGDFSSSELRLAETAIRFECGSMYVAGIVGLGGSLELLAEVGPDEVQRRIRGGTDLLVDRLSEIGADVYSPRGEGEWSGIVSFSFDGEDPKRLKKACLDRGVVISYREGRLRASPHCYNNEQDIEALIAALEWVVGSG